MGRLTQAEATDLQVESLQRDNRQLKSEVARLGAEVVQLKHRLAERTDAHDQLGAKFERLRAVAAERERLLAEGVAIVEGLWAELARLRGRSELDPADRAAILAHVLGTAGRDEPARGEGGGG